MSLQVSEAIPSFLWFGLNRYPLLAIIPSKSFHQVYQCYESDYHLELNCQWIACCVVLTVPNILPVVVVDDFCRVARFKHGYSEEQALGMLFWHKHDVERALNDLVNFAPFPDDWSTEDKVLFSQAFSYHGKSFHRIREMVRSPFHTLQSYHLLPSFPPQ